MPLTRRPFMPGPRAVAHVVPATCCRWVAATAVRLASERGQGTAEYSLVIMGVVAVVGLFVAWASGGALNRLFDSVLDRVISQVTQ